MRSTHYIFETVSKTAISFLSSHKPREDLQTSLSILVGGDLDIDIKQKSSVLCTKLSRFSKIKSIETIHNLNN